MMDVPACGCARLCTYWLWFLGWTKINSPSIAIEITGSFNVFVNIIWQWGPAKAVWLQAPGKEEELGNNWAGRQARSMKCVRRMNFIHNHCTLKSKVILSRFSMQIV